MKFNFYCWETFSQIFGLLTLVVRVDKPKSFSIAWVWSTAEGVEEITVVFVLLIQCFTICPIKTIFNFISHMKIHGKSSLLKNIKEKLSHQKQTLSLKIVCTLDFFISTFLAICHKPLNWVCLAPLQIGSVIWLRHQKGNWRKNKLL